MFGLKFMYARVPIRKRSGLLINVSGKLGFLKKLFLLFTVDGGFSDWSEWLPCDDPSGVLSSCTCRTRECTNPAPKCGGDTCHGERVQVKNCSGRRGQTSNEVDEQGLHLVHGTHIHTGVFTSFIIIITSPSHLPGLLEG